MKKAVLSLSILLAVAPNAFAQDDSSFYVGGRVGASFLENSCEVEPCDNTNVGAGAILGYDFGNNFALEGTYDYLGNVVVNTATTTNVSGVFPTSGDLTTFTLAPKLSYGLSDRTDLYGKIGAAWWSFDSESGVVDDIGYLGAVGFDHRANDLLNLRLEYQYIANIDKTERTINRIYDVKGDSHFVSVGATLHFGRSSAPIVVVPPPEIEPEDELPPPVVNEVVVPDLFTAVQFAFDRKELDSEAVALLQPTLQRLQNIPEATAVVSGYTDSVGTEEYNETLSQERAQTVAQYFSTNGVDARRLVIQGLGESSPIATNSTREGRQMNRRVEVYSPELIVVEQ